MRFVSVSATAFGALQDATLTLAPGMTVVWGQNEAGKSTWHAALYAGLCGARRGRGAGRKENQAFAERYRPWQGNRWEVGAVVELAGGRRVELWHDLAGKVASRATEVTLARDCTAEIVFDGAPDGARWLGLDRRAFFATACVRQADLLGVLNHAGYLQEHLQRAAATSGADATAAAALERIDRFRREHVGQAGRRPQPLAIAEQERARRALQEAQSQHEAHRALVACADELTREAESAAARLRTARSAAERALPVELAERVAQAQHAAERSNARAGLVLPLGAAIVGAVLGLGLLLSGATRLLGVAMLAFATAFVAWTMLRRERRRAGALTALREAEANVARAEAAAGAAAAAQMADLEAAAVAAARVRDEARGRAEERARTLPNVVEAEEALATAEAEMRRLRQLDETLSLTRVLLERAQERVHRTIAPRLATSVAARVPEVTAGRYEEVAVDPQTLDVQARDAGSHWRRASLLSHGTAEQIYLLLRAAMAEHLASTGEPCPLILDDVTVHCDAERKRAVLDTLHALSRDRQIILFTQEQSVLSWAEEALCPAIDALMYLPLGVAAAPFTR